ncbi:hypothetical protein M8R20_03955 [Pseudomonas sp. R2.Fl]|nr:hypothetical protein [Pseudomonas sp. R2.Fl]
MTKLRYYAKTEQRAPTPDLPQAIHSEFLRTGRISRRREDWLPEERRYLTHEEVAEKTGRKLQTAAATTHSRINGFHRSIQFPRIIFHHTLANTPHLGYCHVTAARTNFAKFADVKWSFYIANFFSDIGDAEQFFEKIQPQYSRMYFAVAIEPDKALKTLKIDRSIRDNGLLFRTHDPKEALKNVLKLGAATPQLRAAIDRL